jgi:hypothetical protein
MLCIGGKAQTAEGFGDTARAPVEPTLLAHKQPLRPHNASSRPCPP